MSEHTRTGPYEDGTYRYRGWVLTLWEDCRESPDGCYHTEMGEPGWDAYPPHELRTADFRKVWEAANGEHYTIEGCPEIILSRHVAGDEDPAPTIESAIDAWEAANERLFREAFAQAVREP